MALDTLFSLSALNPLVNGYDPANPNDPYANAYLFSYGGNTRHVSRYTLQNQANDDQIVIGVDPVSLGDEDDIASFDAQIYRRCAIQVVFYGYNVTSAQQYLLIFGLRTLDGGTSAQFFVGTDWVRTEPLSATDEQVALLIDVPGNDVAVHLFVRLAAASAYSAMGFRGMDCYLI